MNYFSRSFLICLGFISAVALAAAGDRFINNPNNNSDVVLQVNKAGVTTSVIKAEGSTGNAIIGSGVGGSSTIKANGSNTDLAIEAVGSGGAVILKANGSEGARVTPNGFLKLTKGMRTTRATGTQTGCTTCTKDFSLFTAIDGAFYMAFCQGGTGDSINGLGSVYSFFSRTLFNNQSGKGDDFSFGGAFVTRGTNGYATMSLSRVNDTDLRVSYSMVGTSQIATLYCQVTLLARPDLAD